MREIIVLRHVSAVVERERVKRRVDRKEDNTVCRPVVIDQFVDPAGKRRCRDRVRVIGKFSRHYKERRRSGRSCGGLLRNGWSYRRRRGGGKSGGDGRYRDYGSGCGKDRRGRGSDDARRRPGSLGYCDCPALFPGLEASAQEDEDDDKDQKHNQHESNPEVRVFPERDTPGFSVFGCRRIPTTVRCRPTRTVPDAYPGRRGLFPFRKACARVVGRKPVIVAEVFPAILAVKRK